MIRGNALTFNAGTWSSPVGVDTAQLQVSCASASLCAATDYAGNAFIYNGSAWGSAQHIDSNAGPFNFLDAVSCAPGSQFCAAVDNDIETFTYQDGSWSAPHPIIDTGGYFDQAGISCPTSSFCALLDDSGNFATFDAGSWSQSTRVLPNGASIISCASATFCAAVDSFGNALTYSNPSAPPPPPPPTNITAPSIAGLAQQGQTLTESHGTWTNNPTSYSYQWEDCDSSGNSCSAIAGATSQTYALTAADVGHTIRVQETASNAGGSNGPANSAATGVVQPVVVQPAALTKPSNSSHPVISGTTTAGQTLTSSTGTWSGTPPISYRYHWERCTSSCSAIAGSTGSSYTLTSADVGAKIAVVVAATNSAGSSSAVSGQIGPVAAAGPTAGQVKAALAKALAVSGRAAKIAQLLEHGGYVVSFSAPSYGRLVISWYLVPKGAHLAKAKKVLVATASVTFHHAGKAKVKITLTAKGRRLLKGAKHVKLTAKSSFTPAGGSRTSTTRAINLKR